MPHPPRARCRCGIGARGQRAARGRAPTGWPQTCKGLLKGLLKGLHKGLHKRLQVTARDWPETCTGLAKDCKRVANDWPVTGQRKSALRWSIPGLFAATMDGVRARPRPGKGCLEGFWRTESAPASLSRASGFNARPAVRGVIPLSGSIAEETARGPMPARKQGKKALFSGSVITIFQRK